MKKSALLFAGAELGGTKCVCILATGRDDIRKQVVIPTTRPDTTLGLIEQTLTSRWLTNSDPIAALGVASFGPLDLRPGSATYGFIRATAKPHWIDTDVRGRLGRSLPVPIGFDTDVNGAALAEHRWGDAQGLAALAYVPVGTGIGVGLIAGGRPIHGFGHPELGHLRIARLPSDTWPGSCPYHGDCVEGLASGTAIAARTGVAAGKLPYDHPVWNSVAFALGQLLHALAVSTCPRKVLLGGGVLTGQPHLLQQVRSNLKSSLNAYVNPSEADPDLIDYVALPGLGTLAGPLGTIALASGALADTEIGSAVNTCT